MKRVVGLVQASGFCYTVDARPSLVLILDILLSCVMATLELWVCRTAPF